MRKTLLIATVIGLLLCNTITLNHCAYTPNERSTNHENNSTVPPAFDKNDLLSWFAPPVGQGISVADTELLQEGMAFEEVIALIGKPQREVGSGVFIFAWEMTTGCELHATFTRSVTSVSEQEAFSLKNYRIVSKDQ